MLINLKYGKHTTVRGINKSSRERRLEVDTVTVTEHRGGIPILNNDFRALAKALERYALGVGNASNATRSDYQRNTFASFGATIHNLDNPNYADVSPKGKQEGPYSNNPFIDGIVKAAEKAQLDTLSTAWSNHYDYDGQGRFHKTTVLVEFDRENEALILGLSAADVGSISTEELATAMGVEQAVESIKVRLELPEMPDQDLSVPLEQRQTFRLDCTPIAGVIKALVETFSDKKVQFKPEDLVSAFMKKSKYNEDEGSFTVSLGNGMLLTLSIEGGDRFVYPSGEKGWENLVDTREAEGSELVLPFPTRFNNKPVTDFGDVPIQTKNYTLIMSVGTNSPGGYELPLPMHTTVQLEKARAVAKFIDEEFKK